MWVEWELKDFGGPMKKAALVILLAILVWAPPSLGQMLGPPYPQLIDSEIARDEFDFFAAAQRQNEWCWAASIQMILNWYHLPVDQAQIVARNYGAPINQGGTDQMISASLNT